MTLTDDQAHSELPPSSADKWFHCPAWRRLNVNLEDTTSEAAEEGTLAHDWFAQHLQGTKDLVDCDVESMYDHLMPCVEWVLAQPHDEVLVETKVDFGDPFGYVDLTGTSDVILVHPKHLTVADLKYGRGLVEVEDNPQLMTYLVGAVHKHGRRPRYRLVILQPRAWHQAGGIREHWLDDIELQVFERELHRAIEANYNPRSKPKAGDYCRHFCKALGRCTAAAERSLLLFRETPVE